VDHDKRLAVSEFHRERRCTLSSVLTGPSDQSCSERSSLGRFDAIHQARALSAIANSVSSSVISKRRGRLRRNS